MPFLSAMWSNFMILISALMACNSISTSDVAGTVGVLRFCNTDFWSDEVNEYWSHCNLNVSIPMRHLSLSDLVLSPFESVFAEGVFVGGIANVRVKK